MNFFLVGVRPLTNLIDAYSNVIFLEALRKGVKIVSSLFSSDLPAHNGEHDGILVWPSNDSSRSRIQLRSGDTFLVGGVMFSLKLCQKTSGDQRTNIVDLESEAASDHGSKADDRPGLFANEASGNQDSKFKDVFRIVESNLDKPTTVEAIAERDAAGDRQCSPVQSVATSQLPQLPKFSDIAKGVVDDDTQDSILQRADDLLERAWLCQNTISSPVNRSGDKDMQGPINDGEQTAAEVFNSATSDLGSVQTLNTLLQYSDSTRNVIPHDLQQKKTSSISFQEPESQASDLIDNESRPMSSEHEAYTGSQENSESTIVVQPWLIDGNSRSIVEIRSKVSSAGNTRLSTNSSFSGLGKSSHGGSSGVDSTISVDPIKVQFGSSTNVDTLPSVMKILRTLGVHKVNITHDSDYLCIGPGSIKMTMNLVAAVASGKPVITDKWAFDSARAKELLDPYDFIAKDGSLVSKLGMSLPEAIERGYLGRRPLGGHKVFFTNVARKDLGKAFGDLKEIATYGGATICTRLPGLKEQMRSIVISSSDDPQLAQLTADGWRCFTKDIITLSVLRSALDLNTTEFVIGGENAGGAGQGQPRGKKRKS